MPQTITRRDFFRAGAAGAATYSAAALAAEVKDIELPFIQVSDTHVSRQRLVDKQKGFDVSSEDSIHRCQAAVKSINECSLPYKLIVHTGDVAHTREPVDDFDLARELLKFERETYYIPGNHDVGYGQTDKFRPLFEERFGVCNRAIEPVAGLRFALFDSQPLDPRAPAEHREQAFARLDKILTPRMPTILFCHVMGIASFFNNSLHEAWTDELMARWIDRLKDGGVFAVLSGHFHRDEQHVVSGVPFYVSEPVINFWGRQTSYRHWVLKNGVLSYRTIYLEM